MAYFVCGSETSTSSAPSPCSSFAAARTAASTSGSSPWTKYSLGKPSLSPFTPREASASQSGTGRGALVESFSSWPAMAASRTAQSSLERASGPT